MTFSNLLAITGSVLLALGGGAAIVYVLARWLGGVWANRILENERSAHGREHEVLVRRRNVYVKLAVSLRVFLRGHDPNASDIRERFLEAYDEASLWAPDSVMNPVGQLLDMIRENTARPGIVSQETLQAAYASCMSAMRRDTGFPNTTFAYRVVSF